MDIYFEKKEILLIEKLRLKIIYNDINLKSNALKIYV